MSNDNLAIWSSVDDTPPSYTKTGNLDGRQVTSINPTYMAKKATEVFGPIGIGWGYEITEERIDTGRPIYVEDNLMGHEMVHTIKLKLWYKWGDDKGEVTHFGHTKFIYWSRNYLSFFQDEEAPKKSLTDALKKCLSMVGFSADIFLGMYEDPNYLESAKQKEQISKADDADLALAKAREEFLTWMEGELKLYDEAKNPAAIKAMHNAHRKKVERQCHALSLPFDKAWKKFEEAYKKATQKDLPEVVCVGCGDVSRDKPGNICRDCGGKKEATD